MAWIDEVPLALKGQQKFNSSKSNLGPASPIANLRRDVSLWGGPPGHEKKALHSSGSFRV